MKYHMMLILTLALLLLFSVGCDSKANSTAEDPLEMTQATGIVFTAGEFCHNSIDGFTALDEVAVDISLTNVISGNATITNMTTGDEAKCDMGQSMRRVVPGDFSCNSISSSNLSGIQVSDQVDISIKLSESDYSVEITNQTSGECVVLILESLNSN